MKRPAAIAAFILFSAYGILAQSTAGSSAFENSTIKLSSPWAIGTHYHRAGLTHLALENKTLRQSISFAYRLPPRSVLGGPAWLDRVRYDSVIETPALSTMEQLLPTMQAFLAARFKLQVHREQTQMLVYNLVAGDSELKIKPSADSQSQGHSLMSQGPPTARVIPARNTNMADFADMLQRVVLDHAVIDKTGLTGRYNFDLEWSSAGSGPDIFTAVQQLGLKLEPAQGLVDTVVVDYAEQPTVN